MNWNYRKVAAILCAAGLAVGALRLPFDKLSAAAHPDKPLPAGLGEESEGGEGRHEWELMRLRDPATGQIPDGIRAKELAYATALQTRAGSVGLLAGDLQWARRGPYNVGGRTRALAVDVTKDATLLAGGVSGGMWRSTDEGESWRRTTSPSQLASATCIAQDTRQGSTAIWYYGTGEVFGNSANANGSDGSYAGDGIFKSTDGGVSWRQLPSTVSNTPQSSQDPFDYVMNMALDPTGSGDGEVYVATSRGIMRSNDGGTTWDQVLGKGSGNINFADVAVTQSGIVYASLSGYGPSSGTDARGLWRSVDGFQWTRITPAAWPSFTQRVAIAQAPSNPNALYFLAETPGGGFATNGSLGTEWHSFWKYTYLTGDGSGSGGKWENRSANLPPYTGGSSGFYSQSSYDLVAKVKPDNENVIFIGGTNLYRSDNAFASGGATSWIGGYHPSGATEQYTNHHPDQHSLAFPKGNPDILYSGCDGGVYRSENPLASSVEWIPLNNGYVNAQFYAIAIDPATPNDPTIIGGIQDNGTVGVTSEDPDAGWLDLLGGDGAYCAIAAGGSVAYASSQSGFTLKGTMSSDGTVQDITRIDPIGGAGYLFINPFLLDPADNNIMYLAGGDQLWRNNQLSSIPASSSYDPISLGWSRIADVSGSAITALGASTASPAHRVYYGTTGGGIIRVDGANGASPVRKDVGSSSFVANGYVNCIAVDPQNGDRAIAVFSNYNVQSLYLTTNGGGSWSAIGGNLEQNPNGTGNGPSCRWAEILHRGAKTYYFVGTSTGLYSTQTLNGSGTVWAEEGAATIGNTVVDMVRSRESDGMVVVATHGNGVFSVKVPLPPDNGSGVEDVATAAGAIGLEQNVPNPVRRGTTIRFTLPAQGGPLQVRLALYGEDGREVATLVDGMLEPGEHEVPVDAGRTGGGLASGIYYYRLSTGGSSVSRQMIVTR